MFALFPINQYLYMVVILRNVIREKGTEEDHGKKKDHHRVHRGTQSNTFFCQYVLGITCLGILS